MKHIENNISNEEALSYYRMNYQALFGEIFNSDELQKLAKDALDKRVNEQNNFKERLQDSIDGFSGSKSFSISPFISSWQINSIQDLIKKEGGLLIALFHFGSHRHVLLDLAGLGVDSVAPIAGQSYWDFYNLRSVAPKSFANKLKLLEVEDNTVGRNLLKNLKDGRVGGIYVDGNMGPTNHDKSEGTIDVDFFQKKISVKIGIARLAVLLKLPILPLFCRSVDGVPTADYGNLIEPKEISKELSRDEKYSLILQQLYSELEDRVKRSPEDWEYALCLHRWISKGKKNTTIVNVCTEIDCNQIDQLWVNISEVSEIRKGDELYWVNTRLGKGFKVPETLMSVFNKYYQLGCTDWQCFKEDVRKSDKDPIALLRQMVVNQLLIVDKKHSI